LSSKINASGQDTSDQRTVRTPQNENKLSGSIVLFVIIMAAVCLVLFALAFWIPQTIWGRSDSAGEH
jgi:hypothetical protein